MPRLVATANPALKEKIHEVHEIDDSDDEERMEVPRSNHIELITTTSVIVIKKEKDEEKKSSYADSFAIRRISTAFAQIGRPFITN